MMQASTNLLNACLAGESVNCCGIELFPLTMREYDDYESCKRALLIRQATLPVAYMAMPYLQALFALPEPVFLPEGVLGYEMVPEIFECVLTER